MNQNKSQKSKAKIKKHKKRNKNDKSGYVNNKRKHMREEDVPDQIPKSRKKAVTHQTLFLNTHKRKKQKLALNMRPTHVFDIGKSPKNLSLRDQMLHKLKAARFRYLNEQMYTNFSKDAKRYFESDPNAYAAYHEGYRQQVAKWHINPVDVIIKKVKKLPEDYVIADFGCGEAKLAKSTSHTVHCFDLVAVDERVTACDMAHVPLKTNSVDVVVFCLSLMGTNLKDYVLEARRVLKNKGTLFIAEVESRFDNVDVFIKNMRSYGFVNTKKDFSHNLFFFLDFVKDNTKMQSTLLDINLNPCLYKKR